MYRIARVPSLLASLAALAGCTGATLSDARASVEQMTFDFTLIADRALFLEQDLEYVDSVGPYAVYEVNGPEPALIGPRVEGRIDGGWVMLCGATNYYRSTDRAQAVDLEFRADESDVTLTTAELRPAEGSEWTNPDDRFTELPEYEAAPDFGALENEGIALTMSPAPPMGSRILLRRVGFEFLRIHNGATASVPAIRCPGGTCELR